MKYLQFLAAVAAVSAFSGPVLAGSVVDNTTRSSPSSATGALLSQVGNGQVAERSVKVDNDAQFVPVQGTIAALSAVLNKQSVEKRHDNIVENTNQVLPIQATLAALSTVSTSRRPLPSATTLSRTTTRSSHRGHPCRPLGYRQRPGLAPQRRRQELRPVRAHPGHRCAPLAGAQRAARQQAR